uniref:Haptoglobin-related protein n=1 Tax=Homo sapiens TaxID=9606 RepID=A0A3B3ISM1_HUMAN
MSTEHLFPTNLVAHTGKTLSSGKGSLITSCEETHPTALLQWPHE